jgi:hypothetical protein
MPNRILYNPYARCLTLALLQGISHKFNMFANLHQVLFSFFRARLVSEHCVFCCEYENHQIW